MIINSFSLAFVPLCFVRSMGSTPRALDRWHWEAACTFCAELLLKEDKEESCLYVYVASNYVTTDRVLVQETINDGVLESLLMLLNLSHSCLLQCVLIRKRCCMVTWDFFHVDMCNMHVPLQTCMFEKKTM